MEWRIAEHECPWGEMAENYRMEYIQYTLIAASQGYTEQTRKSAAARAEAIRRKLFDPPPEENRELRTL